MKRLDILVCERRFVARFWVAAHTTQVVHGPVEGETHSFSVEVRARLHQLHAVQSRVDPEGCHFGSRKPLPAASAVEEVDEE